MYIINCMNIQMLIFQIGMLLPYLFMHVNRGQQDGKYSRPTDDRFPRREL